MKLKDILKGLDYSIISGDFNIDINEIQYDSRKVKKGDLFFCIEGFASDGHKFAQKAVESGAEAIVCQKDIEIDTSITVIKIEDSRKGLAIAASNFYECPAKKMKIIGVTGTNGKTTTVFMLKSILEEAGHKVGLIGTIANYIGQQKLHSERTTPESLELQKLFKEMVDNGVDYCVMEVSSHSLSLDRVYGIEFTSAIFTNLTRDHLDFHKTFENYYKAKLMLFKNTKLSVINMDDEYGKKVKEDVKGKQITFSIDENSDLKCENIVMNYGAVDFQIVFNNNKINFKLNMPGRHNVYNALGCIGACINEGISFEYMKKAFEKVYVPGRCEIASKNYNLGFDIILDYAHTPDGLENILNTARILFNKGKVISVFGCGGDRDNTKRPIMGKIGTELSDLAVITSDNPRNEEPINIINDILKGITKENYIVIENRREAIKKAMQIAKENDVIVIAGKGHEDYQILKNNNVIHFDEREIIKDLVDEL